MTTICYRNGVLAADRQSTHGQDWIAAHGVCKIGRLEDGRLWGFSGNPYQQDAWVGWLRDPGAERPDLGDDSLAILIKPSGEVSRWAHRGSITVDGPFHAIGCGMPAALGAMYAGAGAVRAVEIAALVDTCTGGGVDVLRLAE